MSSSQESVFPEYETETSQTSKLLRKFRETPFVPIGKLKSEETQLHRLSPHGRSIWDGWLCHGGGLWAVQAEAPRGHEDVASPHPHARSSPGLRGGSTNVRCAVFHVSGVRDKAQGGIEG